MILEKYQKELQKKNYNINLKNKNKIQRIKYIKYFNLESICRKKFC